MKAIQFFLGLSIFLNMSCAQNMNKSLEGKSFQISIWDVAHPDKKDADLLIFKDGKMDSDACHQYGFATSAYQQQNKDDNITFNCTIYSSSEGEIQFEGMVKDNAINGKSVWKKPGQADIHYEFSGALKN